MEMLNHLVSFQTLLIKDHDACSLVIVAVNRVKNGFMKFHLIFLAFKCKCDKILPNNSYVFIAKFVAVTRLNRDLLSLENFWSKNTKTVKKLVECPPSRISSTTDPDCLKNTLQL